MMPGLAAKINTISKGGSFSKYVPQVGPTLNNNNSSKSINDTGRVAESRAFRPEPKIDKSEAKPKQAKDVVQAAPKVKQEELLREETKVPVVHKQETKVNGTQKLPPKVPAKAKAKKEEDDDNSKHGLAGRKDVVYKTLLRSVKRYYSNEFDNNTEYASLTKSKQEKR